MEWFFILIILAAICIGPAFIFFGIYGLQVGANDELKVIAVICIVVGILITILEIKKGVEVLIDTIQERKEKKEAKGTNNLLIYNQCLANGITALSSEKDRQRALLIVKQIPKVGTLKNLEKELPKMFQEGLVEHGKLEDRKRDKALENKRASEQNDYRTSILYLNYQGREKRLAMLQADLVEAEAQLTSNEKVHKSIPSMYKVNESDWAIMGGIANGLAGPAAGLATTADIQQKNAAIRAHNASQQPIINTVQSYTRGKVATAQGVVDTLKKWIEQAKIALIGPMSTEVVFQYLSFKDVKIEITECKSIIISTRPELKKDLVIFDDISAHADGAVKVVLVQQGHKIGETQLVFPTWGIGTRFAQQLKAYCIDPTILDCNAPIDVKFEPIHLWAMEA